MTRIHSALIVLLLCFLGGHSFSQEENGLWARTVIISPEKDEVFPGEVIDISLSGFLDPENNFPHGGYRIIAQAGKGKILNGEPSPIPGGKSFAIGDGQITLKYKAPTSDAESDTILIHSDHTLPDDLRPDHEEKDDTELPILEEIGKKTIKIIQTDFIQMRLYDYYHSESGDSWSTTEIDVTIALQFKPLGGAGIGIPFQVTSGTIVDLSGHMASSDGERCDLLSASLPRTFTAMMMYTAPKSSEIESVVVAPMLTKLNWDCSEGLTGIDSVSIGPIRDFDNDAEVEKLRDEMRAYRASVKEKGGRPNYGKIMAMQQAIQRAMVHPDQKVTFRFGNKNFGGKTERTESGENWQLIKRFTWDVNRK